MLNLTNQKRLQIRTNCVFCGGYMYTTYDKEIECYCLIGYCKICGKKNETKIKKVTGSKVGNQS